MMLRTTATRPSAALALVLLSGSLEACARKAPAVGASTKDAQAAAGAGLSAAVFPAPTPRSDGPCMAQDVSGSVQVRAGEHPFAVVARAAVPAPAWLELAAGARLQVDEPRSGHELVFVGPATVEPCTGGEERTSLLLGHFASALASPAPGAEHWVVTPFAIVRYVNAELAIVVDAAHASVDLSRGDAAAFGAGDSAFAALPVGQRRIWSGAALDVAGATLAVGGCESQAVASRSLDLAPGTRDADDADREAHTIARARCAIARLRVRSLPDMSEAYARLGLRLDRVGPL